MISLIFSFCFLIKFLAKIILVFKLFNSSFKASCFCSLLDSKVPFINISLCLDSLADLISKSEISFVISSIRVDKVLIVLSKLNIKSFFCLTISEYNLILISKSSFFCL
ncbi:Uncharacterised protein [Chlamydia trachomatis]|nr:Uncharacterised protein [Chlamydia trachomatis]